MNCFVHSTRTRPRAACSSSSGGTRRGGRRCPSTRRRGRRGRRLGTWRVGELGGRDGERFLRDRAELAEPEQPAGEAERVEQPALGRRQHAALGERDRDRAAELRAPLRGGVLVDLVALEDLLRREARDLAAARVALDRAVADGGRPRERARHGRGGRRRAGRLCDRLLPLLRDALHRRDRNRVSAGRSGGGASARCRRGRLNSAMWQTPVSTMSPRNSTPRSASVARARATSSTWRATKFSFGANVPMPMRSGLSTLRVTVPVSNSAKLRSGM